MPQLVLGSGSPYRAQLLQRLGLEFSVRPPEVDETRHAGEPPTRYVQRLAAEKAQRAAESLPEAVSIGCDQAALLDEAILGKPGGADAAAAQLQRCNGRRVRFLVGLAIHDNRTAATSVRLEWLDATFRDLEPAEIARYVERDRPFDCAGSLRVEGLGISLLDELAGRDPNTLIGLPLIALCEMLREHGLELP